METKFDYLHQHTSLKFKGNGEMFSKIRCFLFSFNVINIFSFTVFYFGFGDVIHFFVLFVVTVFRMLTVMYRKGLYCVYYEVNCG